MLGEFAAQLVGVQRAFGAVPARDPVDGSEDGEDGDLGVEFPKLVVRDALGDDAPERLLVAVAAGDDVALPLGRERGDLEGEGRAAERVGHDAHVLADHVGQPFAGRVQRAGARDDPVQLRQRFLVARVEDRFLVGEVMVEGGLTDAEPFGDVVERGAVVALLAEGAERGVQDLLAPPVVLFAHGGGTDRGGCGGNGHAEGSGSRFERRSIFEHIVGFVKAGMAADIGVFD